MRNTPLPLRIAHRYSPVRVLGEGGMGIVYLVKDEAPPKGRPERVALKFLPHVRMGDLERFRREFVLLSKLNHPYLVKAFDLGFDEARGQSFFTAEFVDGTDLFAATRDQPRVAVFRLLAQVIEAISFMHRLGILHNDLKPSNILVCNGQIKIIDFGIGHHLGEIDPHKPQDEVFGTRAYLAPELLEGAPPSVASDRYALGVIFFKILAGELPVANGPRLVDLKPELPSALSSEVDRMVSQVAWQRPNDLNGIFQALGGISESAKNQKRAQTALVGREALLVQGISAIEAPWPPNHGARWLVVEGKSGMGKSRLLEEFGFRLLLRDLLVIRFSVERAAPVFAPWQQFLSGLSMQSGKAVPPILAEALKEHGGSTRASLIGEPEAVSLEAQMRFYHAALAFLESILRVKPVVVCIDDFHFLSDDAFDFFRFLLRTCFGRLTLLCTVRSLQEPAPLRDLGAEVAPNTRFVLAPLSDQEATLILKPLLGESPAAAVLTTAILERAGGIPGEILRQVDRLIAEDDLKWRNEIWSATPRALERIRAEAPVDWASGLNPHILLAAALSPHPFNVRWLVALTGQDWIVLEQLIATAVLRQLFQRLQDGSIVWIDTARRTEQCAKAKPAETEKLHRLALDILLLDESTHPRGKEACLEHALALGESQIAAQTLLALIQTARQQRALRKAESLFQRMRLLEKDLEPNIKSQFQHGFIEFYVDQGRGSEVRTLLQGWLATSVLGDSVRIFFLLTEAENLRNEGNIPEALRLNAEALASLRSAAHPEMEARLRSQRAALCHLSGDHAQAMVLVNEAIFLARSQGDDMGLAKYLNRKAVFQEAGGFFSEALATYHEAEAIHLRLAHPAGLATAHYNLARLYRKHGDLAKQREYLERAGKAASAAHDLRTSLLVTLARGHASFDALEIAQAEASYLEAAQLARMTSQRNRLAEAFFALARLARVRADYPAAFTYLASGRDALASHDKSMQAYADYYELLLHLACGDIENATRVLQSLQGRLQEKKNVLLSAYTAQLQAALLHLKGEDKKALQDLQQIQEVNLPEEERILWQAERSLLAAEIQIHAGMAEVLLLKLLPELSSARKVFEERGQWFQAIRCLFIESWIQPQGSSLVKPTADLATKITEVPEFQCEMHFFQGSILEQSETRYLEIQKGYGLLLRLCEGNESTTGRVQHRSRHHLWLLEKYRQEQSAPAMLSLQNTRLEETNRWLRRMIKTTQQGVTEKNFLSVAQDIAQTTSAFLVFIRGDGFDFGKLDLTTPEREFLTAERDPIFRSLRGIKQGNQFFAPIFIDQASRLQHVNERVPYGVLLLRECGFANNEMWGDLRRDTLLEWIEIYSNHLKHAQREREWQKRSEEATRTLEITQQALSRNTLTIQHRYNYQKIVGNHSETMRRVFQILDRAIPSTIAVLLYGESGTGKELIAQSIHANGPFADRPFVVVNCGVLEPNLTESVLFGHQKGSFTGATEDRQGLLAQAHGGTVFLDEVGELPLEIQAKFLRALESGEFRPIGSEKAVHAKFRIISATHRNLEQLIAEKKFRLDLLYRLNGLTITVPPLRQRREDIPAIIAHFLQEIAEKSGKPKKRLTPQALRALTLFEWPGNVRQLQHTLEMLTVLTSKRIIDVGDLPPEFRAHGIKFSARHFESLNAAKKVFVRQYLTELLQFTQGNVSAAARQAGIRREHLHRLLKKLKLS